MQMKRSADFCKIRTDSDTHFEMFRCKKATWLKQCLSNSLGIHHQRCLVAGWKADNFLLPFALQAYFELRCSEVSNWLNFEAMELWEVQTWNCLSVVRMMEHSQNIEPSLRTPFLLAAVQCFLLRFPLLTFPWSLRVTLSDWLDLRGQRCGQERKRGIKCLGF